MGVLNVTPDSFSDGGRYGDPEAAVTRARQLFDEGATLVDVGGESSRPGAEPVSVEEESRRVVPVIEALASDLADDRLLSVDTCKPEVARRALAAGAHLVNDITGLSEEMLEVVAAAGAGAIAMHMQGEPRSMQRAPSYDDVVAEVQLALEASLERAKARGVPCLLDPGIGFGKTLEHNLELLANLERLHELGAPLLIGVSRKSMLGRLTGAAVDERLAPTLAAHLLAAQAGVRVLRVHDVLEHRRALRVAAAIESSRRREGGSLAVFVDELTVECSIGVSEEERARPQWLRISVEIELPAREASDTLPSTIDYTEVSTRVRALAAERPRRLVETLADELALHLLECTAARSVQVRIDKPSAATALGARSVGVRRSSPASSRCGEREP